MPLKRQESIKLIKIRILITFMKTKIKILSIILSCLLIIIASSDARQSAKTKSGKEAHIDNINLPQIKTLTRITG